MTIKYLNEQREKYSEKQTYFKNIGFDTLVADFQGIINLIDEMENYVKEKENGI